MSTNCHTPLSDLKVGDRICLVDYVERYPNFIADPGMTGTITTIDGFEIWAKMDKHIDGCEEWDNEILWIIGELGEDEAILRIND